MRCMARLRQNLRGFKLPRKALKNRQLYILLLTLTLSLLVCISAVPSYSQTPTPTPRTVPTFSQTPTPNPRTVIRELAKSDVENDIPRRNDYAVKRYGKEFPELKDYEILEIYDEEYTKQIDEKKTNFWKQLPQKNEWYAAIIIFLLFTFNDVVKEWITNFIKYIVNLFSTLSSGTALFNTISLREYRNGLIEKYQKSSIPYLPQRPLDLHQVYIPLEIESTPENRTDAINALKKHQRLIFRGESGSGKSMLLKYIAFSYAKGHFKNNDKWNDVFSDQPIPVLLELRRLNDSDKTLQQHFVDALDRDGFSNGERFVEHNLQQGKLMLLLDGLDEVNSNILWRVIRDIKDLLDKNSDCRVIITSRTAFYKDEFATELNKAGGSFNILTIADFNEKQIRSFLNLWQRDMPPSRSINRLTDILQRESRIHDLAQRPLILAIIAYLYSYKDLTLAHSITEFYRTSTDILLNQWYSEGNHFLLEDKKRILQQLALFYQEQPQSPYRLDSQKVLNHLRDVIRKLDIDVEPNHANSLLEEIINRSGLMMATDNGTIYQFVHRSFQEFFVAEALQEEEAEALQEEKKNNRAGFAFLAEIQEKVTATGNEKYLIEKFNQDQDRWQEIVRFWSGLAKNPTYVIEKVYEKNQIIALELLAEIHNRHRNIASVAKKVIDEFKIKIFKKDINNDEINRISRAFSSLAVNNAFSTESNVNEIFNFFRETVENKITDISDYKIAVNILSMTYTVEAANILISQYTQREQNYELRQILDQALIRMGDIAVPEIQNAVTNDSINQVMDALVGIATPSALQALVNWLWHKDENRALRAALLLASLIKEEKYEAMLSLCQLPQGYSQNNPVNFDWIVEPYKKEPDSPLHIIVKKIADCISNKLEDSIEVIDQLYIRDFDPKLIIPICFVQVIGQIDIVNFQEGIIQKIAENNIRFEDFIQDFCLNKSFTVWVFLLINLSPVQLILIANVYINMFEIPELNIENRQSWQKCEKSRMENDESDMLKKWNKCEKSTVNFIYLARLISTSFSIDHLKEIIEEYARKQDKKIAQMSSNGSTELISSYNFQSSYSEWNAKNLEKIKKDRSEMQTFLDQLKKIPSEYWRDQEWEGMVIVDKKLARPHKI